MATYRPGKNASFVHNAVNYPAKGFSIDLEDSVIETTTTLSSGWREYVSGLKGVRFTVETLFDPSLAQLGPGDTLTNAVLRLGASYALTVASAVVQRSRPTTSVDNVAMQAIECVATGTVNTTFG